MANKKKSNVVEITIKVNGEKWEKEIDKAFIKANKNAKIDGFRPGKAPKEVYEKKYGKQSLVVDAVDSYMNEAYKSALEKLNDTPIVTPQVSLEKADEKEVIYKFIFTLKPEVKINKYTNLNVKKESSKVTSKEVDSEIEKIRKEYADLVEKKSAIKKGDVIFLDYEGFKDNKPFEGGKAENYQLEIGSNTFIPGFEDALIGLKQNDEKEIPLTFPKDYHHEDLKGKDVIFKVKINEVKEKKYPNLDEEFFKDLGYNDIKTIEEFKKEIKKSLGEKKEYETTNKYIDDLFNALLNETTVEIPCELVHEEIDEMINQYEEKLKMQGLTLDLYLKYTNSTLDKLKEQMHDEASKRIKLRFAVDEIIKLENITATDDEANKDAEEKSKKHNMDKDEYIKAFGGIEMLKYDIKVQKVIEILKK